MANANLLTYDKQSPEIATRTLLGLSLISVLSIFVYGYAAWLRGVWQLYALLGFLVVFTGICFYGYAIARKGKYQTAVILMLGSIAILGMVASLLLANIGVVAGVLIVVLVLQIGFRTLSRDQSFYMLMSSLVLAFFMAATNALPIPFQHVEPLAQPFTLAAAGVIIVVFAIFLVRDFSSLPLRTKLILSFLTICFVSVLGVTLISNYYARTILTQNANETLLAQSLETKRQIDQFLAGTIENLTAEAELSALSRFLELGVHARPSTLEQVQAEAVLTAVSRRDPTHIISYGLLDMTGENIADTQRSRIGSIEADQPYFQQAVATGQPFISDIQVVGAGANAHLYFSAPVRGDSGDIVGVLRLQYDAAVIRQIVEATIDLAGPGSYAILVDDQSILLAHSLVPAQNFRAINPLAADDIRDLQASQRLPLLPPDQLTLGQTEMAQQLAQADETAIFTVRDATTDSINQGAATTIELKPWQIIFFQPQAGILALIDQQTSSIVLATILIVALITFGAIIVAQRLSDPILRLTETAQQVAAGNFDVKAEVVAEDEIGVLTTAFNDMIGQLRDLIGSLEQRVNERTRALRASIDVARHLSTILERDPLIDAVVHEVQAAFDYYHVHIYLFDDDQQHLKLVGGTGEAAQKMMSRGHRLALGQGLVGKAASENAIILSPNVREDKTWLPNPLLPETRAEIAVPIALAGTVIGVLDVQHHVANGLSATDSDLLQSVANQVATAFNNARIYEQVQRQAEREQLINRISQQIQQATSVEAVLQIATQELGEALDVERASIHLQSQLPTSNGRNH
jgi:putative methionine-R-sulfoxide reductase with GAF domain